MCVERVGFQKFLVRPFLIVRREVDYEKFNIIPVWLELTDKHHSVPELLCLAMTKDVIIPKEQTIESFLDLPEVSVGYRHISVAKKAVSLTAYNWLNEAPPDGPEGDFIIFTGTAYGHSFWGTYADSQVAARKFIAENESNAV